MNATERHDKDINLLIENVRGLDAIHGTWGIEKSSDFTIGDVDHYGVYEISTGASTLTVTLPAASSNPYRVLQFLNAGGGAGEIQLLCQGSDTIQYPGGSAASVYIGLPGQTVALQAISGGYQITRGVVQPVAGEPDVGGGWHRTKDANRTGGFVFNGTTNATAGVWSAATSMTKVPAGARAGRCPTLIQKAGAVAIVDFEAATGFTLADISVGTVYMNYEMLFTPVSSSAQRAMVPIPLDASLQFKIAATQVTTTVQVWEPIEYLLGPA